MAERVENPGKKMKAAFKAEAKRKGQVMGQVGGRNMTDKILGSMAAEKSGPNSFSLFRVLLPSVLRTMECGYKYLVVVGYDLGDRYYDTPEAHDEVNAWFETNVAGPARERGITVSLTMAMCNNTQRKPGPVFTTATQAAYAAGADWIYRVNDDSEFMTPWTTKLIGAVTAMGEPYGVAGPLVCNQGGNVKILTHDFTHRTHMEIFKGWYYPAELVDWWMDTWVSRVYGSRRTALVQHVLVGHRTKEHGRRYTVNHKNRELLEPLVELGKSQISAFMRETKVPMDIMLEFMHDKFDGSGADLFNLANSTHATKKSRSC